MAAQGPHSALIKSPAERLSPGRVLTLAGIADGAEGLVSDLDLAVASPADLLGIVAHASAL